MTYQLHPALFQWDYTRRVFRICYNPCVPTLMERLMNGDWPMFWDGSSMVIYHLPNEQFDHV